MPTRQPFFRRCSCLSHPEQWNWGDTVNWIIRVEYLYPDLPICGKTNSAAPSRETPLSPAEPRQKPRTAFCTESTNRLRQQGRASCSAGVGACDRPTGAGGDVAPQVSPVSHRSAPLCELSPRQSVSVAVAADRLPAPGSVAL